MNILDENILEAQRLLLKNWRIRVKQIGQDIGQQGMKDFDAIGGVVVQSVVDF